ncbi:hypothetical protein L6250_02705 [Candidatus Parcubacteria bacterium]|nr:hypothetical protein [Patescibacteria group bacterium]MBU4466951.1 hypothetical protein [Patescibacteria group bacterium]MCG2688518.1 hypothetical protein [Candidatus Parcubacteria bacterium]
MSNIDYQKLSQILFNGLNQRQILVISRRFGLTSGKGETLEAIGKDLGLTRERVRQIIVTALKKIRKENLTSEITKVFLQLAKYLHRNGGLKREDLLFSEPEFNHQQNSASWVNLLLILNEDFYRVNESKDFYSFWMLDSNASVLAEKALKLLEKGLLKQKKTLEFKELLTVSGLAKESDQQFLRSSLEISKKILKAVDGKYGLKSWPEVNPKGVRDLALLVFKKVKKPLHFIEVASLIDEIILGQAKPLGQKDSQDFSVISATAVPKKKTNFQTVHNQLIKDSQFVLIGRGVYALKEWGYDPGTVKDMISKVLKQAKNPLQEKEILKRVLSQRLVKESTILLNLGNKKCFLKQEDGRYSSREA